MPYRRMPRCTTFAAALVLAGAGGARTLRAQQAAAPPIPPDVPDVGTMAPDFTLSGGTRYGLLRDSVRLSDYRGQIVVLAFFPKARTKG
jgi:peroxiredoxin Q/BCP